MLDKVLSALDDLPDGFVPETIIVSSYEAWQELIDYFLNEDVEVLINPAAPEGIFYIR